jgi:glucan phosphoethanolaminetransferase (alkaline phosphatase superfamily)
MPEQLLAGPRNSKLMRLYLLLVVALIIPIALSYGVQPQSVLPKALDITVTGTDQIHIFRAMMCLYLGSALFWAIAAFTPAWQRTAVIWAIFFALSLAVGRLISLIVDGRPSLLLDVYLAVEVLGGLLGLAILITEDRKLKR